MCFCPRCNRMLGDCAVSQHDGWLCWFCKEELFGKENNIPRKEVEGYCWRNNIDLFKWMPKQKDW